MNIGHITHNLLSSKVFIALVVICSVAFPLHDVLYKAISQDEAFMALNVRHYEDSPIAPLTFYLGHIAIDLFGDQIVILRLLKNLLYILTIGFSCTFFYKVTGKGKVAWCLFALFVLTSSIASMDIYNWDTGSYPFLVLTLISTLAYNHKHCLIRSSIMGICCGLMIASRVTTAVAVPFLIVFINVNHHSVIRKIKVTTGFLTSLIITLALLLMLIYGSSTGLQRAWSDDNVITGHGLGAEAILQMVKAFKWTSLNVPMAWMIASSCFLYTILVLRLHRHCYLVTAIICIGMFLFARTFERYDWTAQMCLWQLPAFVFLFMPQLSRMFATGNVEDTAKISLHQWILLLFAVLPGIGSDVILVRIAPMVLMPLILAYTYPEHKRFVTVFCGFMGLIILTMAYYWTKDQHDTPRLNVASTYPRLSGIHYRTADFTETETTKQIFDQLIAEGYQPTFIGNETYKYIYLLAPDSHYSLQHFHYLNLSKEKRYLKNLRNYDAIIVNDPVYQGTDSIAFRSYLHTLGFKDSSPTFAPLPSTTRIYLR